MKNQVSSVKRARAHAQEVLEREAADVAATKPGQRNARLNKAAFAVGQFIGMNLRPLSRNEVEAKLLEAARLAGLRETESSATISSGLAAGIASPRPISELFNAVRAQVSVARAGPKPEVKSPTKDDNQGRALVLWEEARAIQGTPAEVYLRGRGIASALPAALRCHPKAAMPNSDRRHPCLIAAVTVPTTGMLVAVQRTALQPDGSAKASIAHAKASLGATQGAAVVIGNLSSGEAIIEGEGVETVLSVSEAIGWPGIAALSCGALGRAPLPEGKPVVILVDRGAEESALAGARRRHNEGRTVRLAHVPSDLQPGVNGTDANDLLRKFGSAAVRAMIESAQSYRPNASQEPSLPPGFKRRSDGKILCALLSGEGEENWQELCSPLEILAATRDGDGRAWGLLVRAQNPDGQWNELSIARSMLAGDGRELRAELMSLGVTIAPGKEARQQFARLFNTAAPKARALSVSRLGWHERAYILPQASYGDTKGQRIVWQSGCHVAHAYRVAGTLEGWQGRVGAAAVGNSRLILAISAAFAAPLLGLLGLEGGGFHFRGASSTGKTTLLRAAGSAWGGGGIEGFLRRWRTTANGLEGVATLHCDGLLCLDELAEIEGHDANRAAYMLANGQGKQRAGLGGEAKPPHTWRLLFLSTGELSLSAKLAEGGQQATAGQEVRVIDIAADAGAGHGLFENLHGASDADAFARQLSDGTQAHYGLAVRRFLEQLTDDLDGAICEIRKSMSAFEERHSLANASGQVGRVLARFALVAAAGELAVQFGILPWTSEEAMRGVARCWSDWVLTRGGVGDREEDRAFATVRTFLEAHGTSRFAPISDPDRSIVKRVGFYERHPDGSLTYYVLPESWRSEVCNGLDPTFVARVLSKRGALRHEQGSYSARVSVGGERRRVYVVTGAIHDSACPDGPTCPGPGNSSDDAALSS